MFMHMSHLNSLCVTWGGNIFLSFLLFFLTMNRLIDWPGDTKHKGQQNMQKIIIFCFHFFFPKCIFLNKCFIFNLSQGGGGGLTKRKKLITLHVKQSVKMKSTKKKNKCIISEKGGKCVTKYYFSYFAFVLHHHVSVNHAFHSPTSARQKPSSDNFFKKESKNIWSLSSGPIYITFWRFFI